MEHTTFITGTTHLEHKWKCVMLKAFPYMKIQMMRVNVSLYLTLGEALLWKYNCNIKYLNIWNTKKSKLGLAPTSRHTSITSPSLAAALARLEHSSQCHYESQTFSQFVFVRFGGRKDTSPPGLRSNKQTASETCASKRAQALLESRLSWWQRQGKMNEEDGHKGHAASAGLASGLQALNNPFQDFK